MEPVLHVIPIKEVHQSCHMKIGTIISCGGRMKEFVYVAYVSSLPYRA